jgi:hypothetical protein
MDKSLLLTTKQMARFVADGFLQFDAIIPEAINAKALAELQSKETGAWFGYADSGTPLSRMFGKMPGIRAVFDLPRVRGITHSLVGPAPLYDHHANHTVPPNVKESQALHADAIIDTRTHFDVQFYYFPHDTPREMGGTMVIPGSHFRQVNTFDVSRYQNFVGQHRVTCKAGTIIATHHGLWHCAQPNHTDRTRHMFKLRLNPTVKQVKLWNTDDLNDPEIPGILSTTHGWYGNEVRTEYVQRIKLWRYLTGDEKWDMALWMGRIENKPENEMAAV